MTARVLIVEDDDAVAAYLKDAIESAGYEVERAATAYGAVRRVMRGRFDVVLMDMTLQGLYLRDPSDDVPALRAADLNGIVTTLALRGIGYTGPVLQVTGGTLPVDQDMEDAAGYVGRLLKPVLPADIIPALTRLLGPDATR